MLMQRLPTLLLLHLLGQTSASPTTCSYPTNCPNQVLPRSDTQTWMMNQSTIIMPCNNSGFTDPKSTLGWSIVDFDWSNAKGTGNAPGWAKHSPMDDRNVISTSTNDCSSHTRNDCLGVQMFSLCLPVVHICSQALG